MGLQQGFTKFNSFLCLWNSRAQKIWPARTDFCIGEQNVSHKPLVDPKDIILPALHIKLGLFKNFVKALNKDGPAYQYLREFFPKIYAKIKEGIFI